jgi:hypothetical protein
LAFANGRFLFTYFIGGLDMKTEQEMRDEKVPPFGSLEELQAYISSLVDREHDYSTCAQAMGMAATAAYNFVANKLGVTGFQASYGGLDFIRRTMHIDGPFVVITADKELYPQYDNQKRLSECQAQWKDWISGEAKKLLAEKEVAAHPDVVAHWKKLAGVSD